MLEVKLDAPWHISTIVEDTKDFMEVCRAQIQHTYRDGNTLADYLANLAMEGSSKMEFTSFFGPTQAR